MVLREDEILAVVDHFYAKAFLMRKACVMTAARFSLVVENEWIDAGRYGQGCFARPNSQARTGTGKKAGLATFHGWCLAVTKGFLVWRMSLGGGCIVCIRAHVLHETPAPPG